MDLINVFGIWVLRFGDAVMLVVVVSYGSVEVVCDAHVVVSYGFVEVR